MSVPLAVTRIGQSCESPCFDDDRGGDACLLFGWDKGAHEREQLVGEERVEGAAVDVERLAVEDRYLAEAGSIEVADEGTLRQGAGSSPGPRGRMGQDLGREFLLVHGEISEA